MHVYEWLEKENAFLLHCFDSFNVGDVGVRVALWALVEIIFIPISFRRVRLVSLSISSALTVVEERCRYTI